VLGVPEVVAYDFPPLFHLQTPHHSLYEPAGDKPVGARVQKEQRVSPRLGQERGVGHPTAELRIFLPILVQNFSLLGDEPRGFCKASAEEERGTDAVGEKQEADVWREVGGAFGKCGMDVRQAIPGPRSRVENVTDNLEATALFHQPRGKRIDDGSTVRNRVDHHGDGLFPAAGTKSFEGIDTLNGVILESLAVELAVLSKLRGNGGGVVTHVHFPVPLHRWQIHEGTTEQENERLLISLIMAVTEGFGGRLGNM